MKKYLILLLFILLLPPTIEAKRKVFARSFMYTKPGFYDVVMEQALWHDIAYNKKGSVRAGIQAIPFFQQSMSLKKNARYFLIHGKDHLLVAGDETPFILTRDVRAEWLGLPDNFSGILSVNPKQQQKGCMLEYHQDLNRWLDVMILRDMYITALLTISETHNSINLCQTNITNPSSTFPHNIIEAFNQPSWCFSRITNTKKRVGVAELRIKIGSSYISEDSFQLNYYSVIAAPTGNKQNAKIMFEPVNGNNHHLGIGAGINIQAPLNRDLTDYALCFFLDLESVILIRNKQFRTYDLFGKPWSRFIQMNKPNIVDDPIDILETTDLPGVNFMTQKITAKPFNVVDFALGWRMKTRLVEAEAGYGIWGHGNERTDLNQPFTQVFGIAGSAPGKTASRSTIAQKAADDLDFVPIAKTDLNRQTGESFGGFTQRAFMSLGWINKGTTTDTVLGLGASVDVPFHNSFLQLWKIWIKLSVTF